MAALGPTAVTSVHLDAKDEEQRVKALARCVEHATALGTRELIVCGDMNCECAVGSGVGAFTADGHPRRAGADLNDVAGYGLYGTGMCMRYFTAEWRVMLCL